MQGEAAEGAKSLGFVTSEITSAVPVGSALAALNFGDIHFASIDVEGFEAEALRASTCRGGGPGSCVSKQ